MSNADVVYQFLKSKGLTLNVIAAIMGNLKVESDFNPGAGVGNNDQGNGQDSLGIAQWGLGRKDALMRLAQQRGKPWNDLGLQLEFMWSELTGPYAGVFQQIKSAGSAAEAAAIFDAQYEISSGAHRAQRLDYTDQFMSALVGGMTARREPIFSNITSYTGGSGAGAVSFTSGTSAGSLTEKQFRAEVGEELWGLLSSTPELKRLVDKALSIGQPVEDFLQAIHESSWWKTHSDVVRSLIGQKASDPASYALRLKQQQQAIQAQADAMGVVLNAGQMKYLLNASLYEGWSDQELQRHLGMNFGKANPGKVAGGYGAEIQADLKQIAGDYGYLMSDQTLLKWTQKILAGMDNIDGFTENMKNYAKSAFPGLAERIDKGVTVADIADPYVQTYAGLLEVSPDSVSWRHDPIIKKAIQGVPTPDGKPPVSIPLWQFEQQVKADERWGLTKNAHREGAELLAEIGRNWGFAS